MSSCIYFKTSKALGLLRSRTFIYYIYAIGSVADDFLTSDVMRDNLLISIQGHDDHFMGVDLNIEHNIGLQKVGSHLTYAYIL